MAAATGKHNQWQNQLGREDRVPSASDPTRWARLPPGPDLFRDRRVRARRRRRAVAARTLCRRRRRRRHRAAAARMSRPPSPRRRRRRRAASPRSPRRRRRRRVARRVWAPRVYAKTSTIPRSTSISDDSTQMDHNDITPLFYSRSTDLPVLRGRRRVDGDDARRRTELHYSGSVGEVFFQKPSA
jgi:hypothetical protein